LMRSKSVLDRKVNGVRGKKKTAHIRPNKRKCVDRRAVTRNQTKSKQ
jgi:hypothetical protein